MPANDEIDIFANLYPKIYARHKSHANLPVILDVIQDKCKNFFNLQQIEDSLTDTGQWKSFNNLLTFFDECIENSGDEYTAAEVSQKLFVYMFQKTNTHGWCEANFTVKNTALKPFAFREKYQEHILPDSLDNEGSLQEYCFSTVDMLRLATRHGQNFQVFELDHFNYIKDALVAKNQGKQAPLYIRSSSGDNKNTPQWIVFYYTQAGQPILYSESPISEQDKSILIPFLPANTKFDEKGGKVALSMSSGIRAACRVVEYDGAGLKGAALSSSADFFSIFPEYCFYTGIGWNYACTHTLTYDKTTDTFSQLQYNKNYSPTELKFNEHIQFRTYMLGLDRAMEDARYEEGKKRVPYLRTDRKKGIVKFTIPDTFSKGDYEYLKDTVYTEYGNEVIYFFRSQVMENTDPDPDPTVLQPPMLANVATGMALNVFRSCAKEPVLEMHLPAHYQIIPREQRLAVFLLDNNPFITEFNHNEDNKSLVDIKSQLKHLFARNRWLHINKYLPPLLDKFWDISAEYWVAYLKKLPNFLSNDKDVKDFQLCVDEMGLHGLEPVLRYLINYQTTLRPLFGPLEANRESPPVFYAGCDDESSRTEYIEKLAEHIQGGFYFPFKQLQLAFVPDVTASTTFVDLITHINSREEPFSKLILSKCLPSPVQPTDMQKLKTLLDAFKIAAATSGWTCQIQIPDLDRNTDPVLQDLYKTYSELNNIIIKNARQKNALVLVNEVTLFKKPLDKPVAQPADAKTPTVDIKEEKKTEPADALTKEFTLKMKALYQPDDKIPISRANQASLQMQQQQQIKQERNRVLDKEMEKGTAFEDLIPAKLISYDNIDEEFKEEYEKMKADGVDFSNKAPLAKSSEKPLQSFFRTWINAEPSASVKHIIRKMTPLASKMLLKNFRQLSGGLNVYNLPEGFYTQRLANGDLVLGYKSTVGYTTDRNPLTMQLTTSIPVAKKILGDHNQLPDIFNERQRLQLLAQMQPEISTAEREERFNKLKSKVAGDPKWSGFLTFANTQTKKWIIENWELVYLTYRAAPHEIDWLTTKPKLLKPKNELLDFIIDVLSEDSTKSPLRAILERQTLSPKTFKAIGQIYANWDVYGIQRFANILISIENRLDSDFSYSFFTHYLNNCETFAPLLEARTLKIIDKMISDLEKDPHEKELFEAFLELQIANAGWDDIINLYKAFHYFYLNLVDKSVDTIFTVDMLQNLEPAGQNLLPCFERIANCLSKLPSGDLCVNFIQSLTSIDLTEGGVPYAILHDDFNLIASNLELKEFKHGSPSYAPNMAKLYPGPWTDLHTRRAFATKTHIKRSDYDILIKDPIDKDWLVWALHTDWDNAQQLLEFLRNEVSSNFISAVAKHFHNIFYIKNAGYQRYSLDVFKELYKKGEALLKSILQKYPNNTYFYECLNLFPQAEMNAEMDRIIALFQAGPPETTRSLREGFLLASVFGVEAAQLNEFYSTVSSIKRVTSNELIILTTQLTSLERTSLPSEPEARKQIWAAILDGIKKMNANPLQVTKYRLELMQRLRGAEFSLKFNTSESGYYRNVNDKDLEGLGMENFPDHRDRLTDLLKKHIVISDSEADQKPVKPVVEFFKRLQANKTYINEVEPLISTLNKVLEKYPDMVWTADYFYKILMLLQPQDASSGFPFAIMETLLEKTDNKGSISSPFAPTSINELIFEFDKDKVWETALKMILAESETFSRQQQAVLTKLALRTADQPQLLENLINQLKRPTCSNQIRENVLARIEEKTVNFSQILEQVTKLVELDHAEIPGIDEAEKSKNWMATSEILLDTFAAKDKAAKSLKDDKLKHLFNELPAELDSTIKAEIQEKIEVLPSKVEPGEAEADFNAKLAEIYNLVNPSGAAALKSQIEDNLAAYLKAAKAADTKSLLETRVDELFLAAEPSADLKALILHIVAWSSCPSNEYPTLATSSKFIAGNSPKIMKLIQRLEEMATIDPEKLKKLANLYPGKPSADTRELLSLIKDTNKNGTTVEAEAHELFTKKQSLFRQDYQKLSGSRERDLLRMLSLTYVRRGEDKISIAPEDGFKLVLTFNYLKQIEDGTVKVTGSNNKAIHEMTPEELRQAYDACSLALQVEPDNKQLRTQMWAVLFEVIGRTTNKYPHLAQQFALIANDLLIADPSSILQLKTGEGKSHFVAMRAAFNVALGNRVDVCTAKWSLAERDLIDYKAFYNYLGIKTANINARSDAETYKAAQVIYTTPGDLSLFLDEQVSHKKLPAIDLSTNKKHRVGLGDEFDFLFYEGQKVQFNYARHTGISPKEMEWFYRSINEFYDANLKAKPADFTANDVAACFDYLLLKSTDSGRSYLAGMEFMTLYSWIQSAHEAANLKQGINYTVVEELVQVGNEAIPLKEIYPLTKDMQKAVGSTLSFGVHQLLAARKNSEAKIANKPQNYHVHPESIIISSQVFSRRLKTLWDRWEGFTGTVSATQAAELNDDQGTAVLCLPTNRKDLRQWPKPTFFDDEETRLKAIAADIVQKLKAKKSILWCCRTDAEVKDMVQKIKPYIDQIDPEIFKNQFLPHINESKKSSAQVLRDKKDMEGEFLGQKKQGVVLIAAGFGRGDNVDVESVILTGVLDKNDLEQKGGRTARNGEEGEVLQYYDTKEIVRELARLEACLTNFNGVDELSNIKATINKTLNPNSDPLTETSYESLSKDPHDRFTLVLCLRDYIANKENYLSVIFQEAKAALSDSAVNLIGEAEAEKIDKLTVGFGQILSGLEREWLRIKTKHKNNITLCVDDLSKYIKDSITGNGPIADLFHPKNLSFVMPVPKAPKFVWDKPNPVVDASLISLQRMLTKVKYMPREMDYWNVLSRELGGFTPKQRKTLLKQFEKDTDITFQSFLVQMEVIKDDRDEIEKLEEEIIKANQGEFAKSPHWTNIIASLNAMPKDAALEINRFLKEPKPNHIEAINKAYALIKYTSATPPNMSVISRKKFALSFWEDAVTRDALMELPAGCFSEKVYIESEEYLAIKDLIGDLVPISDTENYTKIFNKFLRSLTSNAEHRKRLFTSYERVLKDAPNKLQMLNDLASISETFKSPKHFGILKSLVDKLTNEYNLDRVPVSELNEIWSNLARLGERIIDFLPTIQKILNISGKEFTIKLSVLGKLHPDLILSSLDFLETYFPEEKATDKVVKIKQYKETLTYLGTAFAPEKIEGVDMGQVFDVFGNYLKSSEFNLAPHKQDIFDGIALVAAEGLDKFVADAKFTEPENLTTLLKLSHSLPDYTPKLLEIPAFASSNIFIESKLPAAIGTALEKTADYVDAAGLQEVIKDYKPEQLEKLLKLAKKHEIYGADIMLSSVGNILENELSKAEEDMLLTFYREANMDTWMSNPENFSVKNKAQASSRIALMSLLNRGVFIAKNDQYSGPKAISPIANTALLEKGLAFYSARVSEILSEKPKKKDKARGLTIKQQEEVLEVVSELEVIAGADTAENIPDKTQLSTDIQEQLNLYKKLWFKDKARYKKIDEEIQDLDIENADINYADLMADIRKIKIELINEDIEKAASRRFARFHPDGQSRLYQTLNNIEDIILKAWVKDAHLDVSYSEGFSNSFETTRKEYIAAFKDGLAKWKDIRTTKGYGLFSTNSSKLSDLIDDNDMEDEAIVEYLKTNPKEVSKLPGALRAIVKELLVHDVKKPQPGGPGNP